MRNLVFYLLVALLAFGIGSIVGVKFYLKSVEQLPSAEKIQIIESVPKVENQQIKYGCIDKEDELFWEELNKAAFINLKQRDIKLRYTNSSFTDSPNLDGFDKEWDNFLKNFNCAYFGVDNQIGLVDLNNDGEKEIFVAGRMSQYHGETELFVFQKKNDLWKPILFDIGNWETEISSTKTNGYLDIETKTSVSGGYQSIENYKFNGKYYEDKVCYSNDKVVDLGDEKVILDKPVITREKCFQKISNLLK